MVADVSGTWLFHCHVAEQIQRGMTARFAVTEPSTSGQAAGK